VLNDREQDSLRELQRRLAAEDPEFTRSFDAVGRDTHISFEGVYRLPRWVYTLALVAAVAFTGLMVVARAPWPALLFATLIPIIVVLRRRREQADRREE
jgi:Flp pilus assembly protein TadB